MAFCLAFAACSDADDDTTRPQPTTTAVSTSTTTTTTSPEQADEAALRQLAEDWFEFAPTIFRPGGDPDSAVEFLVDPYLADVRAQASDYSARGLEVRVGERSSQTVEAVEIDGAEAVIVECLVDADHLVETETGEVVNDAVTAYRATTTAVRVEGRWRLSSRVTDQEFEGQDRCTE